MSVQVFGRVRCEFSTCAGEHGGGGGARDRLQLEEAVLGGERAVLQGLGPLG